MAGMRLADWDAVGDLIEAALERPAAERRPYLRQACAGDDHRYATAERLLAFAERATGFLDQPAAAQVAELLQEAVTDPESDPAAATAAMPERIGSWRLLRELGRGGMGTVYLAERADADFHHQVAIKLVRSGLGVAELAARFKYERQILATLDHPHIARLYDGGVTNDGLPYFVMEYVEGQRIDRYCDAHRLDIDARLDLFAQVCGAVAYAHRKLVVHRDLKPANILVDATGAVKLLDFGVAKLVGGATDEPGETDAPVTRAGYRLLTPEYASPEQFLGTPVSTATDVYSLGVLLYALLGGGSPYRVEGTGARAVEKAVLDGEPDRPSNARTAEIADARGTTPDRLRRRLQGDLDTITLTALRKTPEERYASVDALIEDVRRHRARLPIVARPQTFGYRAGRFVRRHRAGVAMSALLAASLLAGSAATLWQARAATLEAQKASRIRDFLVGIFEVNDPDASSGETITARELLDNGAARIDVELAGEPEVRAGIQAVLGTVYRKLGLLEDARPHLESALTQRRTGRATVEELAASLTDLASLEYAAGRYTEAETLQREALDIRLRADGATSVAYAAVALDLAGSLRARGEHEAAAPWYETALRIQRLAGDSGAVARVLNGYGLLKVGAGEVNEGIELLAHAVALRKAEHGPVHTEVAVTLCNLAFARQRAGDYDGAGSAFDECLAIRRARLDPDHPDIGRTLNNMALLAEARGDLAAADSLHRRALEIRQRAFGAFSPEVAGSLNNLAVLAYRRGDLAGAAASFRDVLAQWRELVGDDHPNTITTLNNLGMTLNAAGELTASESVLREALAGRRRVLGDEHPQVAESHANLADLLTKMGRYREAEAENLAAIAILDAEFPDGHPNAASALVGMGRALRPQGRCGEAIPGLERAIAIRVERLGEDNARTADARLWLGRCLSDVGRYDEAGEALERARAALAAANGADHASTREVIAAIDELDRRSAGRRSGR